MVTDEMVEAIDMLIEMCPNEEQVKGMKSVREMLCDFSEDDWLRLGTDSSRTFWLANYISWTRITPEVEVLYS